MIPVNRRKPPPLAATVPEFWEEDAAALRESERDAPPPEADTDRFTPEETALLHERVAEFRKHFNQPGPYLFYTVPGVEIREGTCQTCGERPVAWRLGVRCSLCGTAARLALSVETIKAREREA